MENNLYNLEVQNLIISELTQGKEMARQLEINLSAPTSSPKACEFLVNKIIDSYNRVLSMLKPADVLRGGEIDTITPLTTTTVVTAVETIMESPPSQNGTPRSQDSDMEFKDYDSDIYDKKRKTILERWTKKVQVYPGPASEGNLADGHNWRKYGKKDIQGTKYPRSYYRCTRRSTHGCMATKLVQSTNDNPTIIEITYIGRHTCSPRTSSRSVSAPEKQQEPNNVSGKDHINMIEMHHQDQQALFDDIKPQHFPDEWLFNSPPPPSNNNNVLTVDNYPASANCLLDENHDFSRILSPYPYYTDNLNVHMTDQEMMEKMNSATTSTANYMSVDFDYPFSMFASTSAFGNYQDFSHN